MCWGKLSACGAQIPLPSGAVVLVAAELGWEMEVGIALVWLFLLERLLTYVGSISLEPGNVSATHWVPRDISAPCLGGSTTSCREFLGCGSPKEGALCWMLYHPLRLLWPSAPGTCSFLQNAALGYIP